MRFEDVPVRPTAGQLHRLGSHVPFSLGLLRRLQSAAGALDRAAEDAISGGSSAWAHVLFVYADDDEKDGAFAAAYVDLSKAPETQVWLYASDEDADGVNDGTAVPQVDRGAALAASWSEARRTRMRSLVGALLRRVRSLTAEQAPLVEAVAAHCTTNVKINMQEGLRHVLAPNVTAKGTTTTTAGVNGSVTAVYWDAYDRWLFRVADIPPAPSPVDGDEDLVAVRGFDRPLRWDVVRQPDVSLIQSRTHIPRKEESLLLVPSVALRDGNTLIAWAFLGVDGSIWTLHCEEPFRGRGIAKVLAARLIRLHNGIFSKNTGGIDDGWSHADVSATNPQSQAVCRSIGGQRAWSCAWIILNYDSFGDDIPGEWT
ncbi:gcn5-related n-acetyltransferase [Grosmannia clavigera kw1407]|uniref:Gcn5-related n-acetyltransferase n=1 Tax=Grosmannia clavigera (strain kw1407 / UAMH 11150) TaxID=655863 RepID=F0XKR1_GROCL|nr:gcn5-related n-acetyltransferase [Grosmannia clavigera kw1407]EFX01769.1 gcn5-related n-acetyltransferase [Grosmannia clavigera kw1407]